MTRTATQAPAWHAIAAGETAQRLGVDAHEGLSSTEAARRLDRDGPNRLAEARREPRWRAFLRQFQDLLIVIPDAMRRAPRPARERILTRPRLLRILLASAVMAPGTLAVLATAPGPEPQLGVPTVAGTMAFVTFVFFQAFNLLNVRNDLRSVFSRETLENRSAFVATAGRGRAARPPRRDGRRA